MDRPNQRKQFDFANFPSGILAMLLLFASPGCSWLKRDKLAQYRAENDRLVTEYRSQRDVAARLEVQNRALVGRVAELENRLATISDAVRDPLIGYPTSPRNLGADSGTFRPASQPIFQNLPETAVGESPLGNTPAATDPWRSSPR